MSKSKIFYRGFSSKSASKPGGSYILANKELVNQDLLNHIYTPYFSRPHMPSFGTRIPSLVFEPNDDEVRMIIEEDLRKVFNYDPRVELLELNIYSLPDNNAIVAIANLLYIEMKVTGNLKIEIHSA